MWFRLKLEGETLVSNDRKVSNALSFSVQKLVGGVRRVHLWEKKVGSVSTMNGAFRCFQFLLCCVVLNFTNGERVNSNHTDQGGSLRYLKQGQGRKWITQLMEEAKSAFDIHSEANVRCQRDFDSYKLHLQNQSTWPVRSRCCLINP